MRVESVHDGMPLAPANHRAIDRACKRPSDHEAAKWGLTGVSSTGARLLGMTLIAEPLAGEQCRRLELGDS